MTRPGAWAPDTWTDLVAEDPEAVLESVTVLDGPELDEDLLVVVRTSHGVAHMSLHRAADGSHVRDIELPGAGTIGGPVEHIDGGPVTWFVFTDHTTVPTVYAYDARTDAVTLHARPPGSVEVPTVHSRQVTYTSKDGTEVRMFVLSPTAEPDAPRPTILYGYGGFGVPLTPGYSAAILAWVEAGGVWAIANLRGGSEEGEDWHRAGMLGRKQNVFDDFHAAAEWLIASGWTSAEHLGIYGGSNGGLLVGAAMTQRPDLFNAVVCVAPAARHDPLHDERARPDLDGGVRRPRGRRAVRLAVRLLAVPPRGRGHRLPGDDVRGVRQRHAHRPDARTQDVRGRPARHVRHPARPAAHRGRRGSRRPLPVEVRGGDGRHARLLRELDGAVSDRRASRPRTRSRRSGRPCATSCSACRCRSSASSSWP